MLTKGRKQKSDSCGVRLHSSGSARCEGYYKIGMNEKAKYLEAARRQVDKTQVVDNKKTEEKVRAVLLREVTLDVGVLLDVIEAV